MYTPCLSDADCDTELLCTASNMSLMPGYCTRFCDPSSGGSCPQPRSGTVDAVCFEFASICALGDCEGARCPNGMECMQLSFGGGTLWNCSYR
jgi:hypothetical protein